MNEQERAEIAQWCAAIEDEYGHSYRALCRALSRSGMILGGSQDRDSLVCEVVALVQAGDYGDAAVVLAVLCLLAERQSECGSKVEYTSDLGVIDTRLAIRIRAGATDISSREGSD